MILVCSRGCVWDTADRLSGYTHLRPGDRCPGVIAYDRMVGSTSCRRVLRALPPSAAEVEGAVLRADTNTPDFPHA